MVTKVIQIEGSDHAILPGGHVREVATYFGLDKDVTKNADGTFTISVPDVPYDPDIFYTKDTKRVFIYESSVNGWFEQ